MHIFCVAPRKRQPNKRPVCLQNNVLFSVGFHKKWKLYILFVLQLAVFNRAADRYFLAVIYSMVKLNGKQQIIH